MNPSNGISNDLAPQSMRAWFAINWKNLLIVAVLGILPFLSVLFSGEILFASDQMGSPAWQWYFNGLRHGELPQWNPYIVGGMPSYDANAGSALYFPLLILGFLLPVGYFITWDFVLHTLFAGLAAYLLVQRYFKLDRWISTALAVAYMLNTNFISLIYGGHDGKVHILAWMPLSLYFLLRALGPKGSWKHMIGLSLTVAMFIFTSHLQFTYFVLMGYFFVWLYFLIPPLVEKRFGAAGGVVLRYWVPVLLGMGLIFFMIYPPMKYNEQFSIRGAAARTTYEHATSWSMHPEETASLLVPEFGGLNQNYWGRNYFKLNSEYPGVLVWFLGLLGLFAFRKSRWFWLWGGVGLLAMIYGLGAHTPFFRIFYEFVPGVHVFRAPSMILFWLTAALLLMSGEALRRLTLVGEGALTEAERGKITKRLRISGIVIAGVLILFGLAPDVPYSIWNGMVDLSQIPNFGQQGLGRSSFSLGALRAGALVAVLTWAVIAYLLKARRPMAFGLVALAVTVVDLYWVDSNFIQGVPVERILHKDPIVDFFKSDTSKYRVFGLGGALADVNSQYFGIESVDGRMDHEMTQFRALRGDDPNNPNFMIGLRQNPDGSVSGNTLLDLLNVKYIAFRVANDPGIKLVLNASMLPRAYFVPAWQAVSDSDAFHGIQSPEFNPRRLAYVSTPGIVSGGSAPDSGAGLVEATITKWRYNTQAYSIDAPAQGILVISDLWFPHWTVRVDGVKTPLLRTNFAFRGVQVGPGHHEIEVSYSSPWQRKGLLVSGLSAFCLLLLALFGIFRSKKPDDSKA
jgi:hypothetical protein